MAASKSTQQAVNEIEAFFARKEQETAPAWMPEVGQSVFGEVIALKMGMSPAFGNQEPKPYPIIVLRTEYGPVSLHAFHTLLRDGFKEIGLHMGQRVGVSYDGTKLKNTARDTPEEKRVPTDYYEMYFVADLDMVAEPATETQEAFTLD